MKQLYAYDFDKTLIPYDSFRRYLMFLMRFRPIYILYLLLLRKIHIIDRKRLKQKVTQLVESSTILENKTKHFAKGLFKDIRLSEMSEEAMLLIITASPMVYMKYVAEELHCQLLCSDYIGNEYIEMYGTAKANYLYQSYPSCSYQYEYAASDSKSDMCWMKEFKQFEIVKL